MGKGGKQETELKLPKDIEKAAKENLELAKQVGALPYAPYFGPSVAAFTPAQNAGFGNMNTAANAFGLQGNAGQGMPAPQNYGGFQGYSTKPVYDQAMSQVDPAILQMYKAFFNYPGNAPTQQPTAAKPATSNNSNYFYAVDDYGRPTMYQRGNGSPFK